MLTIKGNQQIVKKEYAVSSFLQLHLSVSGLVELHQSAEEKVEVEADENLLGCIDVMNAGKTLFITSEAGIRRPGFSSLTVRIYFRQLTKLSINCEEAEVISKSTISLLTPLEIKIGGTCNAFLKLDVPVCKLLIQNQGNVTLSGKCTVAEIKTQAEGNLLAKELLVQDLKLKNRSEGNVEVFADNTISISHYGEGFVHYYGNARLSDINQRGDGEVTHLN